MLERDPDAMVAEAAYQLGALSTAGGLRRKLFFGGMASILRDATGVEAAGVLAFSNSVLQPASAIGIVGPWSEHEHAEFLEQSRWAPDDRLVSTTLARTPGPLFRRTHDIIDPDVFRRSRTYNEFQRPRGIGEQAQMCLESSDGANLFVGFARVGSNEPISRRSMEIGQRIAVMIQHCWHAAHACTPRWARELSPRRRRVLELVSDGLDDHQIAAELNVKYHTVRAHLKDLFREAGVRSRLHLIQAIRLDDVFNDPAPTPAKESSAV